MNKERNKKMKIKRIHVATYLPYQEKIGNKYVNCQKWFWQMIKGRIKK
tara:strand:- start:299 stop:442 length:144 start_codon:yes stop_codon:yes gene_type:complete